MPITYRRRRAPVNRRRRRPAAPRYRRRAIVPRAPAMARRMDQYAFKRTKIFTINNAENAAVYLPAFGWKFSLDDLPDYTDFTNLFGLYKITSVVLRFNIDVSPDAQTATNSVSPKLYLENNFTSANNWLDLDDAEQTQKKRALILKPNYKVKHVIRPATFLSGQDYAGSAGEWNQPAWNRWIPTSEPSVQHGYLRMLFQNFPSIYTARMEATYYIQCKNVK